MTTKQYVYRVTEISKITDGDTYWLYLDVGFRQSILVDVRLDGYDCPELFHPHDAQEKLSANQAKEIAAAWISRISKESVWIQTEKDPDSFGRWLGSLWVDGDDGPEYLGEYLNSLGLASIWPTRWYEEFGPK